MYDAEVEATAAEEKVQGIIQLRRRMAFSRSVPRRVCALLLAQKVDAHFLSCFLFPQSIAHACPPVSPRFVSYRAVMCHIVLAESYLAEPNCTVPYCMPRTVRCCAIRFRAVPEHTVLYRAYRNVP